MIHTLRHILHVNSSFFAWLFSLLLIFVLIALSAYTLYRIVSDKSKKSFAEDVYIVSAAVSIAFFILTVTCIIGFYINELL